MQAVADFYAGFALFMLAGSLIGLAVVLFPSGFARFIASHRTGTTERPGPGPAATDPPAPPRSADSDSVRRAA